MNTIEIKYKHIPFGVKFTHGGQEYTKTNFSRGFYIKEGKKVFRGFKKQTTVQTNNEIFDF